MRLTKLLGYSLLLFLIVSISCDSLTNTSSDKQEEIFTVTNDIAERVVDYNSSAKLKDVEASADASDYLSLDFRIKSPSSNGNKTAASHLYLNGDEIYVGYKVTGSEYGGGIDIISADDENREETARSFRSLIFDVQEVVYDSDENAIYVAGAQERLQLNGDKSWLLKVAPNDADVEESTSLSGNVAKSVDTNDDYVFAVSDFDDLYRYDKNLDSEKIQSAGEGVEFRSVAARFQSQVLTLDLEGNVRRTNPSFNGFKLTEQLIGDNEFNTELGIARLNYSNATNPNVALVALNSYGMAILNPSGQSVWSEENGKYYISATALEVSNNETYAFAAGSSEDDQFIDVFDLGPGFQSPDSDLILSLNLNDFDFVTDEPVNHVVATEDHLFVAKGEDGVLVFDIDDLGSIGNKGGKGNKDDDDED